MLSKSEILRVGAIRLLKENAAERRMLLRLIGEKEGSVTAMDLLASLGDEATDGKPAGKRKRRGKHWTQTPAGKRKLRAMSKKQWAGKAQQAQ